MKESSTLNDLTQKLKDKKSRELQQRQAIEQENLKELATSLKTSLTEELSLIKESIYEVQKFVNTKNNTLAKNAEKNTQEIMKNFNQVSQELTKIRAKQWLIPTVMGIAIVLALALGTWGTTKYLSTQLQALQEVRAEVAKAEQIKKSLKAYTAISKIYKNGIELKKNYKINAWQGKDNGLWFAEIIIKKGR